MRRRLLVLLLVVSLLTSAVAQLAVPLVPPVAPPAIAWDVVVLIGGAAYLTWEFLDDFIEVAEGVWEYVGSSLTFREVDPDIEHYLDRGVLPEYAAPEVWPEDPAESSGPGEAVITVGMAAVIKYLSRSAAEPSGEVVYGLPRHSSAGLAGVGPVTRQRWEGLPQHTGRTSYDSMPAAKQDVLDLAVTTGDFNQAGWQVAQMLGWYADKTVWHKGWECDVGCSYSAIADGPYNGLAVQYSQVRNEPFLGRRQWVQRTDLPAEYGELYQLLGDAISEVGATFPEGSTHGDRGKLWPGTYTLVPEWSSEWDTLYTVSGWSEVYLHPTEMYGSATGPNGTAWADVTLFEVVRADVYVPYPNTDYDPESEIADAYAEAVTSVQSLGYLAFADVYGEVWGPEQEWAWYYWGGLVSVDSVYHAWLWHSALMHFARGMVAYAGAELPDLTVELHVGGDVAALPWDVVGAPDFGIAVQEGTGLDVWWLVDPVTALQTAFVPTVGLNARVDNLVGTLQNRFPFALANAISFGGTVAAGPLAVPVIEFAGLRIEADNTWLNGIGAVTRLAATGLLLTLLFVWLRGKFMPKAVI